MKGYIKLHRTILQWEWYKDQKTKILFIHLLLNACYDDCRFMGQSVKKGQYITSMRRLSFDTGLSARELRTCISKLKKTGEIDTQATKNYTRITICNYASYQLEETFDDKQKTNDRQTIDKQKTSINKNIIKKENKNNIFFTESCSDNMWMESLRMHFGVDQDTVCKALEKFTAHLNMTEDFKYGLRQYRTHFVNWLKYNKEEIEGPAKSLYKWKWKGQAMKTGNKIDLQKDKMIFDKPGFEFKIIKNGK